MSQTVFNVGLIGFGLSGGSFHFPYLKSHEGFQLKKVCTNSSKPDFLVNQGIDITHQIEDILNTQDIDLVIITSPNQFHYKQIKQSLQAGKHVLVEKPMVCDKSQVGELFDLAKERELTLHVFQNRRYDRDFLYLKSLFAQNDLDINDVTEFESNFDRFKGASQSYRKNNWRDNAEIPGGGVLFDLGSHLIDQTVNLFGLPKSIFAKLLFQNDSQVDNYFSLQFDYGHFIAHLRAGQLINMPNKRFKLSSQKLGLFKPFLDIQESLLRKEIEPTSLTFKEELYKEKITLQYVNSSPTQVSLGIEGYDTFFSDLHECLIKGINIIPQDEVYNVLNLIDLCFQSHEQKKEINLS